MTFIIHDTSSITLEQRSLALSALIFFGTRGTYAARRRKLSAGVRRGVTARRRQNIYKIHQIHREDAENAVSPPRAFALCGHNHLLGFEVIFLWDIGSATNSQEDQHQTHSAQTQTRQRRIAPIMASCRASRTRPPKATCAPVTNTRRGRGRIPTTIWHPPTPGLRQVVGVRDEEKGPTDRRVRHHPRADDAVLGAQA